MKTNRIFVAAFAGISLLSMANIGRGQAITINSVSATRFCAGDPVSVTFTATGTWFHKNAFTVQLSDVSGSFQNSNFKNLASLIDTVAGTFTIVSSIPSDASQSDHYRFRVMATNPYTVSADNGIDVSIGEAPFLSPVTGGHWFTTWLMNTPLSDIFGNNNYENTHNTIYWDFGANSNPSSAVTGWDLMGPTTTYSAGGLKTAIGRHVAPGGCSVSDTIYIKVLDCTNPVIPHDAYVVNADQDLGALDRTTRRTFWVNPGVSVSGGTYDTIFAEAGATVNDGSSNIVYLKPGAVYTGSSSLVIYADGAGVTPYATKLACSSLNFDYSNAPPNPVMHNTNSVQPEMHPSSIELTPNPTLGNVFVRHAPSLANITVMDLLGRTRMELTPQSSEFTLDLSKLASGTYYVRIASGNSVVTKKIVKD